MAALQRLLPRRARALRDGALRELPAEDLVVGDLLLLEQGDSVPADCRLVAGFGLRVDTAALTGESLSQPRTAEPSPEEEPARAAKSC